MHACVWALCVVQMQHMVEPEVDAPTRRERCKAWAYFNECRETKTMRMLCPHDCKLVKQRLVATSSDHTTFSMTMMNPPKVADGRLFQNVEFTPEFLNHVEVLLDHGRTTEHVWVVRRPQKPNGELEHVMVARGGDTLFNQIAELLFCESCRPDDYDRRQHGLRLSQGEKGVWVRMPPRHNLGSIADQELNAIPDANGSTRTWWAFLEAHIATIVAFCVPSAAFLWAMSTRQRSAGGDANSRISRRMMHMRQVPRAPRQKVA